MDRMVQYRLENKTALVTGATSNIGRAIAVAFAAEGAHVVVAGRSQQRGAEVTGQIKAAGGRADFVAIDLDGTAATCDALAAEATRVLGGRIDILVNNAGIFPGATTATTDEDTFDRVYAVNVKTPFFLTAAVAPGHDRARRRSDHQSRLLDRPARHSGRRPVQLHQGRHRDPDQGVGGRVRPGRRAGQRHLTRGYPVRSGPAGMTSIRLRR